MHDKLIKILLVTSLFFSLTFININGQQNDSLYHFNLDAGVGPAFYLTDMNYENIYSNYPFVFTFRLLWKPEHLLQLGLEFGSLPLFYLEKKFYDTMFGDTETKLSLKSVPIMGVFSMEILKNFEIIGGIGGFVLFSEVSSFNNHVVNTSWSNAYELGASYLYPLKNNLKIGGEAKTYYIARLENYDVVIHFTMRYTFYSY